MRGSGPAGTASLAAVLLLASALPSQAQSDDAFGLDMEFLTPAEKKKQDEVRERQQPPSLACSPSSLAVSVPKGERRAANQNVNVARRAAEKHRRLTRRVATADHDRIGSPAKPRLDIGRRIVNSGTLEFLQPINRKADM